MKSKLRLLFAAIAATSLTGCGATAAMQLASSVTNMTSSVSTASKAAASASSEEFDPTQVEIHEALVALDPLMAAYGTSVIFMFKGQEHWLKSIGQHESAAAIKAEYEALEAGEEIDGDRIDRHVLLSQKAYELISAASESETKLTEEARAEFVKGWTPYLLGLAQTYYVATKAGDYATQVANNATNIAASSGSIYGLVANAGAAVDTYQKGSVLTVLVAGIPGFMQTQYDTLNIISTYASSQNIEKPDDVGEALEEMGDI